MKRAVYLSMIAAVLSSVWLIAQPAGDPGIDGFRMVEVASVSDAMEQLYVQRSYMSHEMRPLSPTKFAGPAVTVLLEKEEHQEGSAASQGMLDADGDGIAVVPGDKAADVLRQSQELDDTEHRMLPVIEKYRSVREAVKLFGRI